ncbi:MAG: NUDIX hydrolase [Candidatus Saccharimonadales bacterium]
MTRENPHGVIDQHHLNRKRDYLYRISIKGLIVNEKGEVLVVKETGRSWWDLPGGGMDHGEDIKAAIARELQEEVSLTGDFSYKVIDVDEPSFLEHANVWQIRLVFHIKPTNMDFEPGEDADEIMFIDPASLKDSAISAEHKVYEYSSLV